MKPATTLILFALFIALATGCTSSRSLSKSAIRMEQEGMYSEAADYYLQALRKNYKNTDARIGLKRTGQRVLDDQFERFYKAFAMEDNRTAVRSYMSAESYYESLSALSVNVSYPSHYKGYFEEAKVKFLAATYEKGSRELSSKEYEEAQKLFKEVLDVDARYKDTKELYKIARIEPIYERGEREMDQGKFRSAYYTFDKIVREDPSYKHASVLKANALNEAQLTVGLVAADGGTLEEEVETKINGYILSDIVNMNNPFLKVVDRSNIDVIMNEQKLGLSGVLDEGTAAEAGLLIGVKTVLLGRAIRVEEKEGKLMRSSRKGFEQYTIRVYDKVTQSYRNVVKYKPVTYLEYKKRNEVRVTYQFQLISSETGEVLATRMYEKSDVDDVNYIDYGGDASRLCGNPKSSDFYSETQRLRRLSRASKKIRQTDDMLKHLYKDIAGQVAGEVNRYEKARN